MIDEKKMKEELKDMVSKAIDELSPEELENISGGEWHRERECCCCPYCGETFSGSLKLVLHIAIKHPELFKNKLK